MSLDSYLDKWKAVPVRTRGLALIAMITALLVGMAGNEHIKRVTGREIVLAAQPVDPRDLLRGAYVAIDYKIEDIYFSTLETPPDIAALRRVEQCYLVLHNDGEAGWRVTQVLAAKPAAVAASDVVVRGKFKRWGGPGRAGDDPPVHLNVDIGADRYFADEKTAKELSEALRGPAAAFDVVLSVGGDGAAVIKALMVNGARRDEGLF